MSWSSSALPRPSRAVRPTALVLLVLTLLAVVPVPVAQAAPVGVGSPEIRPMQQWAAGSACPDVPAGQPRAPSVRLVVHHTHEPVATDAGSVVGVLREICRAHVARGFSTIGYHYLIDPWGRIWAGRGVTGTLASGQVWGAHAAGFNPGSVGVAFIGDHSDQAPSAAAQTAGIELLAWLADQAGIDPHGRVTMTSRGGTGVAVPAGRAVTLDAVGAHRDTSHTECPGEHLMRVLPRLREQAQHTIQRAAHAAQPPPPPPARTTEPGVVVPGRGLAPQGDRASTAHEGSDALPAQLADPHGKAPKPRSERTERPDKARERPSWQRVALELLAGWIG